MKVLWFSNIKLIEGQMNGSGTWISGMNDLLSQYYPEVHIANVTVADVGQVMEELVNGRRQWVLPKSTTSEDIEIFTEIIQSYAPDLIQIWGTEFFWATIPFDKICPEIVVLLDMQGFYSSVLDVLYGDLTIKERMMCIGIKELLRPASSLWGISRNLKRSVNREEDVIRKYTAISVQSKWVKDNVMLLNPQVHTYETRIALRPQFFKSEKWSIDVMVPYTIFSTASMVEPTKGSYTLLKAFREVKRIVPQARLVLAGITQTGIRKSGYLRMLERFINSNGLKDSVEFIGCLDTDNLIKEYLRANVFVNPSYVESYSLILAESTYLGVPTVACYAGAMGELGNDKSVLYFPKYDYRSCASKIIVILTHHEIAKDLSVNSVAFSERKHNPESVAKTQFSIYSSVIR